MPELPEVETVARGLRDQLSRETVKTAFCSGARVFKTDCTLIPGLLPGETVRFIGRRGKYLYLDLGPARLVIHLGMSGRLLMDGPRSLPPERPSQDDPHIHMSIGFRSGKRLLYRDPRKFGRVLLFPDAGDSAMIFSRLGIEPLGPGFTLQAFRRLIKGKRGLIKPFLMSQEHISGMGNIYADEALFLAGIHPETPIEYLGPARIRRLFDSIPLVLKMGIEFGGTTFRDYRNSEGREGRFQEMLSVYGRDGLECLKCGRLLKKIQVGGRSSHFCPACQRKG